ncbi:MAG: hypothetical protein IJ371_00640 [Clostridia bacterium]|nr:hypothetical protein [Clostridia bacterium]
MDKQQIAHNIEKEISLLNNTLTRLQMAYNQAIDSHQARELDIAINELIRHKKILEKIVTNIVEDAKLNAPYTR